MESNREFLNSTILTNLEKIILFNCINKDYYKLTTTYLFMDSFPFAEQEIFRAISNLKSLGYIEEKNNFLKCTAKSNFIEIENYSTYGQFISKNLEIIDSFEVGNHFRSPFLKYPFISEENIFISNYRLEGKESKHIFDELKALYYLIVDIHTRLLTVSWIINYYTDEDNPGKDISFYGKNYFEFLNKLKTIKGKAAFHLIFIVEDLIQGIEHNIMYEYTGRLQQYSYSKIPILDNFTQRIITDFFPTNQFFINGLSTVDTTKTIRKGVIDHVESTIISNINIKNIQCISTDFYDKIYVFDLEDNNFFGQGFSILIPKISIVNYQNVDYSLNDARIKNKAYVIKVSYWRIITENDDLYEVYPVDYLSLDLYWEGQWFES